MGLFKKLKKKWNDWYYHDIDDDDEAFDWEEDEQQPRDDSFYADKDQRAVYVLGELEKMAEAAGFTPEEAYEDYPQIENGVGLIRSFREDFFFAEEELESFPRETAATVITGIDGEKALRPIAESLAAEKNLRLELVAVRNAFFGDTVTVTGLLTAGDIIKALEEKEGAKGV